MSESRNTEAEWRKVGECLYCYTSSGAYYARIKKNGKEIRRSLKTKDLPLAKRRLRKLRDDLEKVDLAHGRIAVEELLTRYKATRQHLGPSSQERDGTIGKAFEKDWPGGMKQQVRDVKPSDVMTWLGFQRKRISKSYYNEFVWFIRKMFELAIDDRILIDSPAEKVQALRRDTPIRETPDWNQFKAMVADIRAQSLNADAEASADFVEFMGLSGIGNSEAANLTWGDIDLQKNRIRVYRNKTDTGFVIPIYPQLLPFLERLKGDRKPKPSDPVLKVKDVRKALAGTCKRLNLPHFTQRSLRRCFITRAVELGIDFKTIAQMQGHRDGGVLIAKTYSHLRQEHLDNMAERLTEE